VLAQRVATPLCAGDELHEPVGKSSRVKIASYIGNDATKEKSSSYIRGEFRRGPGQALGRLHSSHGMSCRRSDHRILRRSLAQRFVMSKLDEAWGKLTRSTPGSRQAISGRCARVHGIDPIFVSRASVLDLRVR